MKNNITIEQMDYNEQHKILDFIHQDEILQKTFGGNKDTRARIARSDYVGLIKNDQVPIGFVLLVQSVINDAHEVDIGIFSKYRNKGYGTAALNELKQIIQNQNIKLELQVKKDNISAIRTAEKNDFLLNRTDENYNYYRDDISSKQK